MDGSYFVLLSGYETNTYIYCFQRPESLVPKTNKLENIYMLGMYKYVIICTHIYKVS